MIPIYMMTNDNSMHILPASAYLFNKFWPAKDNVIVLCFKEPKGLPKNFKAVSLGKQASFSFNRDGRTYYRWSDSILPYFKKMRHKTFILIWDEHIVVKPVDVTLLNAMISEVSCGSAAKAILDRHLNEGRFSRGTTDYAEGLVKLNQKTLYRTTLMPSIWGRQHFMGQLRKEMTAWDFEMTNLYRSFRDGACIIAPKKKDAVTTYNVYMKGKFAAGGFKRLRLSDADRVIALKHIKTKGTIYA